MCDKHVEALMSTTKIVQEHILLKRQVVKNYEHPTLPNIYIPKFLKFKLKAQHTSILVNTLE